MVINPNNPTGAVYSRQVLQQMVDLARQHQLLLLADEIYDKILYDDAEHISLATMAPDLSVDFQRPVQGLPGGRLPIRLAGHHWGPPITPPVSSRASACWPICGCARMFLRSMPFRWHPGGHQSIDDLVLPGGRLLEQRDLAWAKLNEIPGSPA